MTKYIVTLERAEFRTTGNRMPASEVYDAVMYPDNDARAIAAFDTEAEANAFGAKLIEDGKVFTRAGFDIPAQRITTAAVATIQLVEVDEVELDDPTNAREIFAFGEVIGDGTPIAQGWLKDSTPVEEPAEDFGEFEGFYWRGKEYIFEGAGIAVWAADGIVHETTDAEDLEAVDTETNRAVFLADAIETSREWARDNYASMPAYPSELVEFYAEFTATAPDKRDSRFYDKLWTYTNADNLADFLASTNVTEDFLAFIVRHLDPRRDWDEDFGWKLTDSVRIRDIEEQDEDGEYIHIRYEID